MEIDCTMYSYKSSLCINLFTCHPNTYSVDALVQVEDTKSAASAALLGELSKMVDQNLQQRLKYRFLPLVWCSVRLSTI